MSLTPEQVNALETLATQLFSSPSAEERSSATQTVQQIFSQSNSFDICKWLFQQSNSSYALVLSSQTLLRLIKNYWYSLSLQQTIDLNTTLLQWLATKSVQQPHYVISPILQCIARITKLGWKNSDEFTAIPQRIMTDFVTLSPQHALYGIQLLIELIHEINSPNIGSGMLQSDYRRTTRLFRDNALKSIFEFSFTTLTTAASSGAAEQKPIATASLTLIAACLSYDFIGIMVDESAIEESIHLQIPASWSPYFTDRSKIQMIADTSYRFNNDANVATQCLEVLTLMATARRSLFRDESERVTFLTSMITVTFTMLQRSNEILNKHETIYHQFCRLISRLKSNYSLSELMLVQNWSEWLQQIAGFTSAAFTNYDTIVNSVSYLLLFWSKLATELPYHKGENIPQFIEEGLPQLACAFMTARLDRLAAASSAGDDLDEYFDMVALTEQLRQLPVLARYQYTVTRDYLQQRLSPIMSAYKSIVNAGQNGTAIPNDVALKLRDAEAQLALMLHFIGSIIGFDRQLPLDMATRDSNDAIDGIVCSWLFELLPLIIERSRSAQLNATIPNNQYLALGLIYALNQFRTRFLSFAGRGLLVGDSLYIQELEQIFSAVSDKDGIQQTPQQSLSSMCDYILYSLNQFSSNDEIVRAAIELLDALSTGYSTGTMLANLDVMQGLITSHSPETLSFLKQTSLARYHSQFYGILSRLVFRSAHGPALFELFVVPFEQTLNTLDKSDMRTEPAKRQGIHLCAALKGVIGACSGFNSYTLVYTWLETFLPTILRLIETWSDSADVTTPVLKLFSELVNNTNQRIRFDNNSADGIILFRQASKVLQTYGNRILSVKDEQGDEEDGVTSAAASSSTSTDMYKKKLKGYNLAMKVLIRSVSGGFVNFSIMQLYNDKALHQAVTTVIKLLFSVNLNDLLSFPKVTHHYFTLLEVLFRSHTALMATLFDTTVFVALLSSCHEGLQLQNPQVVTYASATIDHLFSYIQQVSSLKRPTQQDHDALKVLKQHMLQVGSIPSEMLSTLMTLFLFDNADNSYVILRPIYALIAYDQRTLSNYQQHLIQCQATDEQRQRLQQDFATLTQNVDMTNALVGRDVFSTNAAEFRQRLLTYAIRPS